MPTVEQDIVVEAPVDRVYGLWTNYEALPHFMENVKEVRETSPGRTHWIVEAAGRTVEWDANMIQETNRRVAWNAEGESRQSGEVRFEPIGQTRTRVHVKFDYSLPSKVEEGVASALQIDDHAVREDLKNFKALAEGDRTPI